MQTYAISLFILRLRIRQILEPKVGHDGKHKFMHCAYALFARYQSQQINATWQQLVRPC